MRRYFATVMIQSYLVLYTRTLQVCLHTACGVWLDYKSTVCSKPNSFESLRDRLFTMLLSNAKRKIVHV